MTTDKFTTDVGKLIIEACDHVARAQWHLTVEQLGAYISVTNSKIAQVWGERHVCWSRMPGVTEFFPYELVLMQSKGNTIHVQLRVVYCATEEHDHQVRICSLPKLGSSMPAHTVSQILAHNLQTQKKRYIKNRFRDDDENTRELFPL